MVGQDSLDDLRFCIAPAGHWHSPGFGMLLMLAFALGRAVPILLGVAALGWLGSLARVSRLHRLFEVIGGVLLMLSGLHLLNAYFLAVSALAV